VIAAASRSSRSATPSATPGLARDGAERLAGALDETALAAIEGVFRSEDGGKPGVRLRDASGALGKVLSRGGAVGRIARAWMGPASRPVRILLFNKRAEANWALGLHQDRTIAVAARHEVDGFGPWTVKAGQLHVQPPQSVIDRMLTLRIHVDDVGADAAPLLILAGSHRLGRLCEAAIDAAVSANPPVACLARRGDVWIYATAIVHGSDAYRATGGQRRVLQVDYAADDLPGGLAWALPDG